MSAAASPTTRSDDSLNEFLLAAMTPILVGSIISVLVYVSIPYLPVPQEAAERYLAQSPVQKVIVWLFCAGISSVFLRAFRLRAAYQALGLAPLTTFPLAGADDLQILDRARTELAGLPRRIQRTPLVRRLTQVIGWMLARRSVAGMEGQLRQRAEAAQLRQHERTAGVRLSSWGMMLLGFVGTIGGLATAIAKVPADELTSALALLTGGLGTAFDATVLSLALSLILVFSSFAVERVELQMLARVDEQATRTMVMLFPPLDADGSLPYQGMSEAESRAAERVLQRTEVLIQRQAQLWEDALERTRERWVTTLDSQTEALNDSLRAGMGLSLTSHSEQLALSREDFLKVFERASSKLVDGIARALEQQSALHTDLVGNFDAMVRKAADALGAIQRDERHQIDALIRSMNERITKWHSELKDTSDATREMTIELRRQAKTLLEIVSQEEELSRLQGRLTENLEALRATNEFDDAVHNLSAAVHLLTARTKPKAA
ncbi:MAG: hypothetical protein IT428_08605 [Planctomycetaceae bacterium]|nr:hypothetical protein [Planctomycetaceae bacterium]